MKMKWQRVSQRGEAEGEGNGGDEEDLARVGCFREMFGFCKKETFVMNTLFKKREEQGGGDG